MSKGGSSGVNKSMMVSRGMIVKEDDEDVIESPEGSPREQSPEGLKQVRRE